MRVKKVIILIVLFAVISMIQEIAGNYYVNYMNIDVREYPDTYDDNINTEHIPYYLQLFHGDSYEIAEKAFEYSTAWDAGYIVKTEILQKTEGEGKIPLKVTYSLGAEPFKGGGYKNLYDTEELFWEGNLPENIISYNEFKMADGSSRRMIFCEGASVNDPPYLIIHEDGQGDYGDRVYGEIADKPFSFDGRFALQPEDYNNDGKPDCIYKIANPDRNGCLYALHYTDMQREEIYLYGVTSDSARLDRIDRNTFFYITRNLNGKAVPMILKSDSAYYGYNKSTDTGDYINNGWVFTSYYENGVTTLKGTPVSKNADKNPYAQISVKKLDGLVWRHINVPLFNTCLSAPSNYLNNFRSDTATIAKELEEGIYKIEVTVNGKTTETEFIVRE